MVYYPSAGYNETGMTFGVNRMKDVTPKQQPLVIENANSPLIEHHENITNWKDGKIIEVDPKTIDIDGN